MCFSTLHCSVLCFLCMCARLFLLAALLGVINDDDDDDDDDDRPAVTRLDGIRPSDISRLKS